MEALQKHISNNLLRDFSTLFSRSEVLRWFKDDFKSINIKLSRYNLINHFRERTYLDILKKVYKLLEENYPNEYIIKNEFLNNWLRHEIGKSFSLIFNEFRLGKAIADLSMFNGVSKAFEIKTILDNEFRLSNQLNEYKKLFNEVYIIVPKEYLHKYSKLDNDIGIISHDYKNKEFQLEKSSKFNNVVDVDILMNVLHTKEYIGIVKDYFQFLPEMNSFNQFKICKEKLSQIPHEDLNNIFIKFMKNRKKNNIFFNKSNSEFNQISLSLNFNNLEKDFLISKLQNKRL